MHSIIYIDGVVTMKYAIKTALASMVFLVGTTSVVNAAGAGSGTVKFLGTIIEAACSIEPGSVDQDVPFGQVAKSQLEEGGVSQTEEFYIKLTGCDTSTLKTVTSTFTGAASADVPDALGIVGAGGVGIMMKDGAGATIKLGVPTTAQTLQDGDNTLSFGAYLKGASEAGKVVTGDFSAITNFSLAYQ